MTWKEFEELCEDIKKNPDKYDWIIFDPLLGTTIRKAGENGKVVHL